MVMADNIRLGSADIYNHIYQGGFLAEWICDGNFICRGSNNKHIVMYIVRKYMCILQSWLESCLVLVETPPPALDGE